MAGADITGAEELAELFRGAEERLMEGLPVVLQNEANAITIDARHNHTYTTRTGNLERSTTNKVHPDGLGVSIYLDDQLTTTRDGYHYGAGVHNGTKPHEIRPKTKTALKWGKNFAKRVQHPGTKPDPFLKEANDRHEQQFKNAITEEIWHSLTRQR